MGTSIPISGLNPRLAKCLNKFFRFVDSSSQALMLGLHSIVCRVSEAVEPDEQPRAEAEDRRAEGEALP